MQAGRQYEGAVIKEFETESNGETVTACSSYHQVSYDVLASSTGTSRQPYVEDIMLFEP